jgi:hypothetical protein
MEKPVPQENGRVWEDAEAELRGILHITDNKSQKRRFCAVSVGKRVRFFEWDRASSGLTTLADGASLYMDRQCATVARWLKFFADNHQ